MLELILFIYLLRKKWAVPKKVKEQTNFLAYTPGFISDKEIEDSVNFMQKYAFQAMMLIYTHILNMLDDKNVIIIQFQMYGLGHIWRKGIRGNNADGTFQLAVALKLATELKKIFPELIMTSQEPCHRPDEIEYLRNRNIHVFERRSFSPDHFINQLSKVKISNQGLMICYMIHFSINDFEDFLAAHWNSEILCKIIFVGNWFLDPIFSEHIEKYKKTKEFCEMVDYRKTLPFEYPNFERNKNDFYGFGQWPPYSNHPSDFLSWLSFGNGHIFGISYENAKMLIQKVM